MSRTDTASPLHPISFVLPKLSPRRNKVAPPLFTFRGGNSSISVREPHGEVIVFLEDTVAIGALPARFATLHPEIPYFDELEGLVQSTDEAHNVAKASGLSTLARFEPDFALELDFRRKFNGRGLDFLTNWMIDGHLDEQKSKRLLGSIVEDALIGTFAFLRDSNQMEIVLNLADEILLMNALVKRIPRLSLQEKRAIAKDIVSQLRRDLARHRLIVDGGLVGVVDGCFVATVGSGQHVPNLPLAITASPMPLAA